MDPDISRHIPTMKGNAAHESNTTAPSEPNATHSANSGLRGRLFLDLLQRIGHTVMNGRFSTRPPYTFILDRSTSYRSVLAVSCIAWKYSKNLHNPGKDGRSSPTFTCPLSYSRAALTVMTSKADCQRASLNAFLRSISRRAHTVSSRTGASSKSCRILAQIEVPSLRPPAQRRKLGKKGVKHSVHSFFLIVAGLYCVTAWPEKWGG